MDALAIGAYSEAPASSWVGQLDLELEPRAGRTRITHVSHRGPLRVQRPFYPEQDGTAHIYLIHPPGGVVAGDHLRVGLHAREGSRSLMTTPAATKFYRSLGETCVLQNRIVVEPGAILEWLPQESIAFGGSESRIETTVTLEGDALFSYWELTCLGRPASEDAFSAGCLLQKTEIQRDGIPLFVDRLELRAGSELLSTAWGLAGLTVVGTFVFCGGTDEVLDAARAALEPSVQAGLGRLAATRLAGAVVVRFLGRRVADAHIAFRRVWEATRPLHSGRTATEPRIWRL